MSDVELSDEMLEAIRILRSDGRIEAYERMTESHQKLVERMDRKDGEDKAWREEWQNKSTKVDEPKKKTDGDLEIPPPPEVSEQPKDEENKPKKKSRWWGEEGD